MTIKKVRYEGTFTKAEDGREYVFMGQSPMWAVCNEIGQVDGFYETRIAARFMAFGSAQANV